MSTVTSALYRAVTRLAATMVVLFLLLGSGLPLQAQSVYFACYVPLTGTVYRIREANLKTGCTTGHVEFSWTDGANAVRRTDPLGGDLSGVFANANVVRLLGRALSTTAPQSGQVLTWNGTEWIATTPASGGGTSDHGALTGLGDDDHPQYLLSNGVRHATNGFAVTGTAGTGSLLVSGPGTRMLWYPGKAAFRAGQVNGSQWDDGNIGPLSTAFGSNTVASGTNSVAMGVDASATGPMAIALGSQTAASGQHATSLGGLTTASGFASTASGHGTLASGHYSTALGDGSTASGFASTAMGAGSIASGSNSTAFGESTIASGDYSTAMGQFASTNQQDGSFVYGDASTVNPVLASRVNQFVVRAQHFWLGTNNSVSHAPFSFLYTSTGAYLSTGGTWTNASDIALKNAFRDVNADDVLNKIARLPIRSWSYKAEDPSVRHVGPTAQDFRAAFGLSNAETSIATVDADGISLLGIQALEKRTRELSRANQSLEKRTQELERENQTLRARLDRLEAALKQQQH